MNKPIPLIKMALLLGTSMLLINTVQAQAVYKWKDEKGATHYTQTPPPVRHAQKVDIKTKAPAASATASTPVANKPAQAEKKTAPAQPATPPALSAQVCQQLQEDLALLQSGRRMYENDAGGERAYLTEEQKAARIQAYSQSMAQGCR